MSEDRDRPVVSRDPKVHSGDVVFAGTRVPVERLLEHLEDGGSIDDFLTGYPTVTRWQVEAVQQCATVLNWRSRWPRAPSASHRQRP